jgi:hypothetical protein
LFQQLSESRSALFRLTRGIFRFSAWSNVACNKFTFYGDQRWFHTLYNSINNWN